MIIIDTCPKCGYDLVSEAICSYPPINYKVCCRCGWHWAENREEIKRVPFQPYSTDKSNLASRYGIFSKSACLTCPNNPANGGSGICNCTLGQMVVTC